MIFEADNIEEESINYGVKTKRKLFRGEELMMKFNSEIDITVDTSR